MAFVNTFQGVFGELVPIFDALNAPSNKNISGVFGEFIPIFDPYSGDTTTYWDADLISIVMSLGSVTFQNIVFYGILFNFGSGGGGSTPDYVIVDGDVAQLTSDILYTKLE